MIQNFDLHKPPQTRQRPGERPATARQVRKLRKLSKAYDPTPITEDDAERLTRDAIAIELQRLEIRERPTRAIEEQRARADERETGRRTTAARYRADHQATCHHQPGRGLDAGCCLKCGCELQSEGS